VTVTAVAAVAVTAAAAVALFPSLKAVSESENFYHFTLVLPGGFVPRPGGPKPHSRSWILGCYTKDERREWLEAILNARLPVDQQVRGQTLFEVYKNNMLVTCHGRSYMT
jgi:hypothetical protein